VIKTVILDTTLLTLLVVGLTDRRYIASHKRLSEFVSEDFDLLVATLEQAEAMVVSPNTLTETSNWLRQIKEPARSQIQNVFRAIIRQYREICVASTNASDRQEFIQLGLTDTVILEIAKSDVVVVSTDLDLCIAAEIAEYSCVNFNHLRDKHFY
jgi:predicted nucleic acid-binding protein